MFAQGGEAPALLDESTLEIEKKARGIALRDDPAVASKEKRTGGTTDCCGLVKPSPPLVGEEVEKWAAATNLTNVVSHP